MLGFYKKALLTLLGLLLLSALVVYWGLNRTFLRSVLLPTWPAMTASRSG